MSEIRPGDNMKVLVYGNSGAGKTCLAAGFPLDIIYLDFDGKADSAAAFFKQDADRLARIEVRDLSAKLSEDPIEELMKIIQGELIPQQKSGAMKFRTLVIDSLTTFSASVLAHIVRTNPGIKRVATKQGQQPGMQDFGVLKREFARLIPGILSLPMNIVMLAHIKTDKDEMTGEMIRGPHMDGSFAMELPIYFKEVFRAFVDDKGQHMLQTKSDAKYNCRTQLCGIPGTVRSSYEELKKYT